MNAQDIHNLPNAQNGQATQNMQNMQNMQDLQRIQEPVRQYVEVPVEVAHPVHTRGIVLPVVLIGLGVLFLLSTMEIMDWGTWGNIWRLWPLILIAFGLEILVGRKSTVGALLIAGLLLVALATALAVWAWKPYAGQTITTETISRSLQGAREANVSLDFGAGTFTLGDLSDSSDLISGSIERGAGETITQDFYTSGDTAFLTIKSKSEWVIPFWDDAQWHRSWDLNLNRSVPVDLSINTGVGEATLDLEKLNLTNFDLNTGAGNTDVTMPANGNFNASIDAGVGNLTLTIPEGMAARIQIDSGLGNTDVAGEYTHKGDLYESPGYDEAANRIDLDIDGGVGNITIR